MTLQIFPSQSPAPDPSDLGSLPLPAAIARYGHRGECWRIQTAEGPVYLILDGSIKRWARKSTGEPRVCFTVTEIARMVAALGPCPVEQPWTFDSFVRPWILMKREFPMAEIVEIEKAVPF